MVLREVAVRMMDGGAELRPCPFCGASAEVVRHPEIAEILRVACTATACRVQPRTEFLLEEYAEELWSAWNMRTDGERVTGEGSESEALFEAAARL